MSHDQKDNHFQAELNKENYPVDYWLEQTVYSTYDVGAMAKWLKRRTADAQVPGLSPNHGMEELSMSSFNHCFTPPRYNGYLALGNLSDGTGSSS